MMAISITLPPFRRLPDHADETDHSLPGRQRRACCERREFRQSEGRGDPVDIAAAYDEEGADELCFLDITASHENRQTIIDVVERTAARVFMPVTVGGGVRTLDDIRALLNAGADKVSINTAAVQRPELVKEAAQRFGTQCIVVAIDAKRATAPGRWEVFTHGGRKTTGLDAVEWAQRMERTEPAKSC